MITIQIECAKDVFTKALDIFIRPQFLVEFAELFFSHFRGARIAVQAEALLPSEDIFLFQRRIFRNRLIDVIIDLHLIGAHDMQPIDRSRRREYCSNSSLDQNEWQTSSLTCSVGASLVLAR